MRRGTLTIAFLAGVLVGAAVVHLLGGAGPAADPDVTVTHVDHGLAPEADLDPERREEGHADLRPPAAATLEGLGATAEERAFLRRALADERARRREAVIRPSDGGLDVLRRRLEYGADLSALVADYERFASHVRPPQGPVFEVASDGDVTRLTRDRVPEGTTVLQFGPGTFEVPALRMLDVLRDRERTAPALEIRGAGMERTTLIGLTDWHVLGRVEHLVLRDFTWVGGERTGMMLSVHGHASARIENVRIRGWRSGGHSAAIGASGSSYLALRGCEFLGSRRGKNDGALGISLRDDCVVLVQDCLFADLPGAAFAGWNGNGERAGVWIRDCTFENAALATYGGEDEHWLQVHARGGTAAFGPATWTPEERRRRWFSGVAGSVEGVSLGPGIARCTTADMARALDRYEPPTDHRVLGIELTEFDREGPLAFRLHVGGAGVWPGIRVTLRWDEPAQQDGEGGGSFSNVPPDRLAEALPIRTLLERVEAPAGVTIHRFAYGMHMSPDGISSLLAIQIRLPWGYWIYDARTGALLEHRSW